MSIDPAKFLVGAALGVIVAAMVIGVAWWWAGRWFRREQTRLDAADQARAEKLQALLKKDSAK